MTSTPRTLVLFTVLFFLVAGPFFLPSIAEQPRPESSSRVTNLRSPLDYDFKLVNETVHISPNKDGSVFINYSIEFENYGSEFEYIDVGFPNDYFLLSSVEAYWALEGDAYEELTNIAHSSVIPIGVEIYVPSYLRPGYGERGTIIVWGTNPRMIYPDTQHEGYVGYEFVPTWYDSDYCRSVDWLGVHLHFPNGFFNGTEAFYHYTAPTRTYYGNTSLVYVWEYGFHTPTAIQHGISFPYHEDYITTYFQPDIEYLIQLWLDEWGWLLALAVVGLFFICCIAAITISRHRAGKAVRLGKRKYLPPAVKVEALGIRRGLTVVEAAVLNEVPLHRVFIMIVYSLLRKGLITINREPKGKPLFIRDEDAISKAAKGRGTLHYYERLFLKAITPAHNLHKTHIRTLLNTLIKTTARKLEGYSRSASKTYYARMITRAWTEMDQATTPAQQAKTLNGYAEWLLLDPQYEDRIRPYHHYYAPTWYWYWWWAAHPRPWTYTGPHPTTTAHPTTPISITTFANGVVLGTQHFANSVVTGFQNLANQIATGFRPPPRTPATRRSTYRGRSCACACACVSCACACAGGGR